MNVGICLMCKGQAFPDRIGALLSKCGLSVWASDSAQAYSHDARSAFTQCLIIDMPGETGLQLLLTLRSHGVRTPALLVTGDMHPSAQLEKAGALDVLPRPVDVRVLLSWIECVCAANMVMGKRGDLLAQLMQIRGANARRAHAAKAEVMGQWPVAKAAAG